MSPVQQPLEQQARAKPAVGSLIAGAGSLVGEGESRASENPARPGEPVGSFSTVGVDAVDAAVKAGVDALKAWRRRSALDRAAVLRRAAALLRERAGDLAALLTAEEGKTLDDSLKEVRGSADIVEYHASSAWWPNGETFHSSSPGDLIRTLRVPVGVVGVITPWNFPVSIPAWKVAPALVHGNAVVWKPATPTPIVSIRLAEVFHDAGVPPAVLQVLLGDGGVGAAIVEHHAVDAVSFTGSEGVGRQVAAAAATRNAKCQLELGGHNPAIVLDDADLDLAVGSILRGVANGTGQKCTATRRIIAQDGIRDRLVEALEGRFSALRIGDGAVPGTEVGPLVDAGARDTVARQIEQALSEGCEVATTAAPIPDAGAFLAPVILAAQDQSATICREEVFGPVAVVVPARDADHALELAADTRFGLSAALFTSDQAVQLRAAEDLPVGLLNINRPSTGTELHLPFGGARASSAPGPSEQGSAAREFYTERRSVFTTVVP